MFVRFRGKADIGPAIAYQSRFMSNALVDLPADLVQLTPDGAFEHRVNRRLSQLPRFRWLRILAMTEHVLDWLRFLSRDCSASSCPQIAMRKKVARDADLIGSRDCPGRRSSIAGVIGEFECPGAGLCAVSPLARPRNRTERLL